MTTATVHAGADYGAGDRLAVSYVLIDAALTSRAYASASVWASHIFSELRDKLSAEFFCLAVHGGESSRADHAVISSGNINEFVRGLAADLVRTADTEVAAFIAAHKDRPASESREPAEQPSGNSADTSRPETASEADTIHLALSNNRSSQVIVPVSRQSSKGLRLQFCPHPAGEPASSYDYLRVSVEPLKVAVDAPSVESGGGA